MLQGPYPHAKFVIELAVSGIIIESADTCTISFLITISFTITQYSYTIFQFPIANCFKTESARYISSQWIWCFSKILPQSDSDFLKTKSPYCNNAITHLLHRYNGLGDTWVSAPHNWAWRRPAGPVGHSCVETGTVSSHKGPSPPSDSPPPRDHRLRKRACGDEPHGRLPELGPPFLREKRGKLREDIIIHNYWLQPKWCSIQEQCIAFPI